MPLTIRPNQQQSAARGAVVYNQLACDRLGSAVVLAREWVRVQPGDVRMQTKYSNVGEDRAPGSVLEPFAVNLEHSPVEGAGDSQSGQLTWRTLISGDRSPSDQLIIGVADFPPHGRLNVHRHEPAEFYFGLSGEGTVVVKGIEYRIGKGVAVFIPGNTDHGVVAGPSALSILYGFARRAFSEIVYDFGERGS